MLEGVWDIEFPTLSSVGGEHCRRDAQFVKRSIAVGHDYALAMPEIAFLLLESDVVHPSRIIDKGEELGITLAVQDRAAEEDAPEVTVFEIAGTNETLMIMPMNVPHPDVANMPRGPLSPNGDLTAAPAHAIVTALGLRGTQRQIDTRMAALTAAVLAGCDAVGAMLGFGALFHNPDLFADLATLGAKENSLPLEICVDITGARESETHMSFLTHNMPRYGREDFYITAPIEGKGALDFLLGVMRWLLGDPDKQLPTGDTVGRSAEEKIRVERVPNPAGSGDKVIWLDLP